MMVTHTNSGGFTQGLKEAKGEIMKESKKLFLGVLLILLAAGVAFATGSGESAAPGQKKVIELWHIQTTAPFPEIIQGSVDRFMAANPDYQVNISMIANDSFKEKIAVAVRSGQTPDIFHSWSGGTMEEYADNDIIVDLSSYISSAKSRYLDAAISQVTYKNKIWGVPVENVAIAMVYYNKALYDQYGLKVPTTVRELEANCEVLKQHGVIPFALANAQSWTGDMYYQFFATRYGGTASFQAAMRGTGSFDAQNFVQAGRHIQDWVKKGYFNEGINSLAEDAGQSRQLLYSGKAAMYVMGTWATSQIQSENPEYYKTLGMFNFPAIDGGRGDPNTVVGTVGDNFYHVASSSKYPDKAFELITYLLDDQAVQPRIAGGRVPPLKNIRLSDPISQQVVDVLGKAPDLQFWYDQSLNPAVTQIHLQTSQELFGLSITPENAAAQWAQAQKDFLSGK
jgi:raffinose/stachyose/melibiose transport system substrate-binding protein